MNSQTTTKCGKCHRVLRSAKSIELGYGPTCHAKVRAAAKISGHKPGQVAKALELIADGGIVALRKRKTPVFTVVSSNGGDRYLTAAQACTCAAGLKGRSTCYHRIAAELLAA